MIKIMGIAVFGLIGVTFIVMGFIKSDTTAIGSGFVILGVPVLIVLASTVFRKHFDTEESGRFGLGVLAVMVSGQKLSPSSRLEILDSEAACLFSTGDYKSAAEAGKQALKVAEEISGPDHPDVARSLGNLGMAHIALRQYAQAEPLYRRALTILEKAFGPDDANIAACLNRLAEIHVNRGQYAQAEPLCKRSLATLQKTLGPDHPEVATLLENMAELYRKMDGRRVKAQALTKMAANIRGAAH